MRAQLVAHPWFVELTRHPGAETYFVFADSSLREPRLDGKNLYLPCQDSYARLAAKTAEMMRYFAKRTDIDYLVKIDDSFLNSLPQRFLDRKEAAAYLTGHYSGAVAQFTLPITTARWLKQKNLIGHKPVCIGTPFYGGKYYVLSQRALQACVRNMDTYLECFLREHGGVEDVMIGYILARHFLPFGDRLRLYRGAIATTIQRIPLRMYLLMRIIRQGFVRR
jgi:hypothetical protein